MLLAILSVAAPHPLQPVQQDDGVSSSGGVSNHSVHELRLWILSSSAVRDARRRGRGSSQREAELVYRADDGSMLAICACAKCGTTSFFNWMYEPASGVKTKTEGSDHALRTPERHPSSLPPERRALALASAGRAQGELVRATVPPPGLRPAGQLRP